MSPTQWPVFQTVPVSCDYPANKVLQHSRAELTVSVTAQNDPGSVASYQIPPLGNPSPFQTGVQGYCNASSAMPGFGAPSNTPYCTSSQPTWSSYRCGPHPFTSQKTYYIAIICKHSSVLFLVCSLHSVHIFCSAGMLRRLPANMCTPSMVASSEHPKLV